MANFWMWTSFCLLVTGVLFWYYITVGPLVSSTGVPFWYNITVGQVSMIIMIIHCTVLNRDFTHSLASNIQIIFGFSKGNPCQFLIAIRKYYVIIGSKYLGKYLNRIGFSGPTDFLNGTHGPSTNALTSISL